MPCRSPIYLATALSLVCTLGTSSLFAADNAAADQKANAALAKIAETPAEAPDKLFATQAAMGNLWEVELSKVVNEKAQDTKVKELAQMIMKDHQAANEKLMPIVQKMGLDLPTDLTSEKQGMLNIMAALPPDQLEAGYLMDMKADHLKDVTSYADHEAAVKDADLRAYISGTLPKLREHTQHVMMLATEKGIGKKAGMMGGAMGDHPHSMGGEGTNAPGSVSADGSSGTSSGPQRDPNAPAAH